MAPNYASKHWQTHDVTRWWLMIPDDTQWLMMKWVPRGGADLALAFLSEGPRFEPCPRQLWKKLFQDEISDSHTREWDDNACIIGAWHNSLDRSPRWYLVSPLLKENNWYVQKMWGLRLKLILAKIKVRQLWQLKKLKSWVSFWSY